MAANSCENKKSNSSSLRRESCRRIPLTAFTLLTVPEDPMLSAYLRSRETIDLSLAKTMAGAKLENRPIFQSASESTRGDLQPPAKKARFSYDDRTTKSNITELDLELDKFMASLTAAEAPDAVIRTIIGDQKLKPLRK